MTRRTRTILVVAIAVITATLASVGVVIAIRRMPARDAAVPHEYVVVARRSLSVGTLVTEEDVKVVAWPAANPLPGRFADAKAVVQRGLISPVLENEPITESKLASAGAGGGLAPTIPVTMRAISVKVNEVIGVAGFVLPGSRVDVVVTVGQRDESFSRIVVSNVEVLTAGTKYDQEEAKDGKPVRSTVVTLMVTPADAERIALATTEGQVTLTLRNPLDVKPTATPGIRLAALMGGPAAPAPARPRTPGASRPAPAPAPPPTPYVVEAIRASQRTEEKVR